MAETPDDHRPSSDARAEQDLRLRLETLRTVGTNQGEINAVIARNVLHDDLGRFGVEDLTHYGLDQATRDRLIAHARQDAAVASLHSLSSLKAATDAQRVAYHCRGLLIAILIVVAYVAMKVS